MTIHKVNIPVTVRPTELKLHVGAKVLCVQNQRELIAMWVLQNTSYQLEKRWFVVYPTGSDMVEVGRLYIGTVQTRSGNLVWHIFEEYGP